MVDVYPNWAALAAANTLGVDYRLPIRKNTASAASIAIHGGSIEPGSSEVASMLAARCRHNYYSLEGIKPSGNADLSIQSTNYDEPKALALVKSVDYCFSVHGVSDITGGVAETLVNGLDTTSRDTIIAQLQGFGFAASSGSIEGDSISVNNIANKTARGMGVNIGMTLTLRQSFFPGGDTSRANRETGIRTETFYKYVKAIAYAINSFGGGAAQTDRYDLNLAGPDDYMSDFETWLNSNYEKLRKATAPPSGTTLPQAGPYNLGDRFYKTDTKSIYILIVKDAIWGWHWRPVQDAISPWLTVPATCLNVAGWTLNGTPANPFAIAFDNRGKCYWRGIIGVTSGTIARNTSVGLFKPLPNGLRPRQAGVYMLGHETLSVSTDGTNLNSWQGGRIFLPESSTGNPSVRVFGGTADPTKIHLGGVNYAVATAKYTTP